MKKILHIIDNMGDGGAQRVVLDYLERKGSLNKYDLEFLALNPPTNSTYDIYIKHNKLPFKYLVVNIGSFLLFVSKIPSSLVDILTLDLPSTVKLEFRESTWIVTLGGTSFIS